MNGSIFHNAIANANVHSQRSLQEYQKSAIMAESSQEEERSPSKTDWEQPSKQKRIRLLVFKRVELKDWKKRFKDPQQ